MVQFITASLLGPEAAKQPQTITLPPPYFTIGMMFFSEMLCYFYARCKGTQTFQKVQLLSHQSTEYFPKSLGVHQDVFWKTETSLCVLFAQQQFLSWNSAMQAIFTQSLSYGGIMNTDLN